MRSAQQREHLESISDGGFDSGHKQSTEGGVI